MSAPVSNAHIGRVVPVEVVDGVLLIDGMPSCPECMDPTPCEQQCFAPRHRLEIVHRPQTVGVTP